MPKISLTMQGQEFLFNGAPAYRESAGSDERAHGLLVNARFLQGIFSSTVTDHAPSRSAFRVVAPFIHTLV